MPVALVGGTTRTARIDGISAAGADPSLMAHTPGADLEIVAYGRPVRAPIVPVSPSGCPTPAVVTRAVRELVGFETVPFDAGMAGPTAARVRTLASEPGGDVRTATPVPGAAPIYRDAVAAGRSMADDAAESDDPVVIGETIPGGTTTALGVLTALGERRTVSSSLAENPLTSKRAIVADGLDASGLAPGDAAREPLTAIACLGDPVLAGVAGLAKGAIAAGRDVVLAGGTQLAAAAAVLRHDGCDADLTLATTRFVADDPSADLRALATDLGLDLVVSDPGFDPGAHPATDAYLAGAAKEGVGMGGALALFERSSRPPDALQRRVERITDGLTDRQPPLSA